MTAKKLILLFTAIVIFYSCSENNNEDFMNKNIIINNELYKATNTTNYNIKNISIDGNLLRISVASSGCSGSTWKAILIDSGDIAESDPIQRSVKLALENKEACLAIFIREFTFDITVLKEQFSEIILNLDGWNSQIRL